MNFAKYIFKQNKDNLDKVALIDDTKSITYKDLEYYTKCYAQYLLDTGLSAKQRIIINLDDCVEWPIVFLGAISIGVVPILASTTLLKNQINLIKQKTNSKLVVNQKDNILSHTKQIKEFYSHGYDDECYMLMSSGTTGQPKFVVHRHTSLENLSKLVTPVYEIDRQSNILSTAKLSFTYGHNNSLTFGLTQGSTVFLINGILPSSKIYKKLIDNNITHFLTVPSVIRNMVRNNKNNILSRSVKVVVSSGESLPLSIAEEFESLHNISILDGLGMSEVMYNYCTQTNTNKQIGTIGIPISGVECKVCDEDGNIVPKGQYGELYVKHPCTAMYYLDNPTETKKTFINGWVKTKDNVYVNGNDNYVYVSRCDDLIKINGLYVSPVEIESELLKNKLISDCAVISKTSTNGFNEIHAYVVSSFKLSNSDLNFDLNKVLPNYKLPKHYHFVDSIPKSNTGKTSRSKLKIST